MARSAARVASGVGVGAVSGEDVEAGAGGALGSSGVELAGASLGGAVDGATEATSLGGALAGSLGVAVAVAVASGGGLAGDPVGATVGSSTGGKSTTVSCWVPEASRLTTIA